MAGEDYMNDAYLAGLLVKDARESTIKYSTLGIDAFLTPSQPPPNKPKPNTRFLRTIIKETDNHNAALLAKEERESRARLEGLETKERRSALDVRRRQLGHITAHLTGGSAKRRSTEDPERSSRRQKTSGEEAGRRRTSKSDDKRRGTEKGTQESRDSARNSHKHHRSRSEERSRRGDDRRERDSRARSRSPRERRERDPRHQYRSSRLTSEDGEGKERDRKRTRRRSPSVDIRKEIDKKIYARKNAPVDDDSDPLDEIIGPRPPPVQQVRSRGRGTTSAASGIDSRFSSNYDPTVDIQLDPDEDNDWDQALEALRDRTKWRQQGADRLRAAGFTDEEVLKWEKGGEKNEEDVKWAKQGEGREWDRGKVVDSDEVESWIVEKNVDLSFGRLKGT